MKRLLPTQPNQPRPWEEGQGPPPGSYQSGNTAEVVPRERVGSWLALAPFWDVKWKTQLYILAWLGFFSFVSYGMLTRFVVMAVIVQGRSMVPTLHDGERYLLNRLTYLYRAPERNDLVVIRDPGHDDYAVKRIVAMPGEVIRFKSGDVYLNGQKLEESFLAPGTKTCCSDAEEVLFVVGKNRYFVLGDNRSCSEDSRTYGTVHRSQVLGLLAK